MERVVVLIAHGANDFQLPCRILPNIEIAKFICDNIFGKESRDVSGTPTYDINLENEEKPWPISNVLFTRFYYGCGGPYRFTLEEVRFDTNFIHWDLD